MQYIVIMGNPRDGFSFIGPFDTSEKATTYILSEPDSHGFWAAELNAPDESDTQD